MDPFIGEVGVRLRDVEERQKILKDRILLIGQNLIDFKEKISSEVTDLKKDLEIMKQDVKRMKDFLDSLANETSNFARHSDLEVLQKQAKMFQPLNLITKDEVKELIEQELRKHKTE